MRFNNQSIEYIKNYLNNRGLITYIPYVLERLYSTNGIAKNIIDVPVDDAFTKGLSITTQEAKKEEIEKLEKYLHKIGFIDTIKRSLKYSRLFGTSLISIVNEKEDKEVNIDNITTNSELGFITFAKQSISKVIFTDSYNMQLSNGETIYKNNSLCLYNTIPLNNETNESDYNVSCSVFENCIEAITLYTRANITISELLSEAKINIFKADWQSAKANGTEDKLNSNIQNIANHLDNQSAVLLDKDTDFETKQIAFNGIESLIDKLSDNLCANTGLPFSKIFGRPSSGGLNTDNDEIGTNYRNFIESSIRAKIEPFIRYVLPILFKKVNGYLDETVDFTWSSLANPNPDQETKKAEMQLDVLSNLRADGTITAKQYVDHLNSLGILPEQIQDESEEINRLDV